MPSDDEFWKIPPGDPAHDGPPAPPMWSHEFKDRKLVGVLWTSSSAGLEIHRKDPHPWPDDARKVLTDLPPDHVKEIQGTHKATLEAVRSLPESERRDQWVAELESRIQIAARVLRKYVFRKEGKKYTIQFGTEGPVSLKAKKGLDYIAFLLRESGRAPMTPLELEAAVTGAASPDEVYAGMSSDQLEQEGLHSDESAGSVGLDDRARGEYRDHLQFLESERRKAERDHDQATLEKAGREMEALIQELTGTQKTMWTPEQENARNRIGIAVKRAISEIREAGLPDLAEHLEQAVHPYAFPPTYSPDDPKIDWDA